MENNVLQQQSIDSFDRNNIWVFNSANRFAGNVKYLFIYIVKYRPDIFACYMSEDKEVIEYIKSLGYRAYLFNSEEAHYIMSRTGVYVCEQVKEHIPDLLLNTKYLNLFHGVGLKQIERKVNNIMFDRRIAKKYIKYNEYIIKNMLFLVTSPMMEKHFQSQLALDNQQIIRGDYPRNAYQKQFDKISTFNHNIKQIKGMGENAKIALYAPTYREKDIQNFIVAAFPNLDKLVEKLKELNFLLIIKLHDQFNDDIYYKKIKEKYNKYPQLLFWDNKNDIYEILSDIDLCIYDYSSIFYDFLAHGVKNYIKYIFDFKSYDRLMYDYEQLTCGKTCTNFEELLKSLNNYEKNTDIKKINKIKELFWSYSNADSLEYIINTTLSFQIRYALKLPTLYSFDIFDTLIKRKCLAPQGIFYGVKQKIINSEEKFPDIFKERYPAIRQQAEANVREYIKKTIHLNPKGREEITFEQIFDRLKEIYNLDQNQISLLKNWELELELENVIAIEENISKVEKLIENNEKVILISDMYLSIDFIKELLNKANKILSSLPIFLSSDIGLQKSTGNLFIHIYKSFSFYNFKKWKHHGDNSKADDSIPKSLNIETELYKTPQFNAYELSLTRYLNSYDGYIIAALFSRFRFKTVSQKDYFTFAYISLYFYPYISWVIKDTLNKKIDCLYFISRDGYFLKAIADHVININSINIKTKYIYGSRIAWRIASFINEIDDDFFGYYGNLKNITNFEALLDALDIDKYDFIQLFPDLEYIVDKKHLTSETIKMLSSYFRSSNVYKEYILNRAKMLRKDVCSYLRQEIDITKSFAFVEFWARGYTQTCMTRLLNNAFNSDIEVDYYYFRSILPSQEKNIRYNYTTNNTSLIFIESIFANMPYKSISHYTLKNDKFTPQIVRQNFDYELYFSMSNYLTYFIDHFYKCEFITSRETVERFLSDFSLAWYRDHQDDKLLAQCIGSLKDNVAIFEEQQEFAPAFTKEHIEQIKQGLSVNEITKSIKMSLARSSSAIQKEYNDIINKLKSRNTTLNVNKKTELYHIQAKKCYKNNELKKASEISKEALSQNSQLGWAYFYISQWYNKLNKKEEAIEYQQKAILYDSENTNYKEYLSSLLRKNGDLDGAAAIAKEALNQNPELGWAYLQLSRWHESKNQIDEAIETRRKAVEFNPDQIWYREHLSKLLYSQKKIEEAAQVAQEALSLDPHLGWAYIQLSRWHDSRNEIDEAIETRRKAIELEPEKLWYTDYLKTLLHKKAALTRVKLS